MTSQPIVVNEDPKKGDYGALSLAGRPPPSVEVDGVLWPSVDRYLLWYTMVAGRAVSVAPLTSMWSGGLQAYTSDMLPAATAERKKAQVEIDEKVSYAKARLLGALAGRQDILDEIAGSKEGGSNEYPPKRSGESEESYVERLAQLPDRPKEGRRLLQEKLKSVDEEVAEVSEELQKLNEEEEKLYERDLKKDLKK